MISSLTYGRGEAGASFEEDVFTEHRFSPRVSGVLHTFARQTATGDAEEEAEASLKRRMVGGDRWTVAMQAGGLWAGATAGTCPRAGAELRALAGATSKTGRRFVNLEAAYRYRAGCARARYELTTGYRPDEKWLWLAQTFVDDDLTFDREIKIQASAVRFDRKRRGLQLSVRARISDAGVNEPALVLGYWTKLR